LNEKGRKIITPYSTALQITRRNSFTARERIGWFKSATTCGRKILRKPEFSLPNQAFICFAIA
jgi:hypothetical protein